MKQTHAQFLSLLVLAGLLAACQGKSKLDSAVEQWGSRGGTPGRFVAPRVVVARDGAVIVIDRTGRVQKFTPEGAFLHQWKMERIKNGTPTGLAVDQEGHLWIPDTHNSRILQYSADGILLSAFGHYGEDPGQFIYPTDLAFDSQGNIVIVEYGVHDRVQVFSPEGRYMDGWGDFGPGEEQFNRPMSIELGPDQNFYIADSANHRIKVYNQEKQLIRILGKKGSAPGEFLFPFDLDFDEQGALYVCEFGNHRIQKLTLQGEFLGAWGEPGSGLGQFAQPWSLSVYGGKIYVADTKNHRIQVALLASVFP